MAKIIIENIIVPYNREMSSSDVDRIAVERADKKIFKMTGEKCTLLRIHKKSIDARRKSEIKFVYSVYAEISAKKERLTSIRTQGVKLYENEVFEFTEGNKRLNQRPVIVGFGPAGIFCALALAENGYKPIVYERGGSIRDRISDVEHFYKSGKLNRESNIQFGAGGAGSFSDGKLTTRINDSLCSYVLSRLVDFGAPEDIMWKAKPHIGSDILRDVVENADRVITSAGGSIHYNSKVSILKNGISVNGDTEDYGVLVLALGHSARDTYAELMNKGFLIEPKPFSAGVRIEHLQSELDRAMFGDLAGDETLGRAEYNLSYREGKRGVYSFCMCPGGEVMAAASEEGGVVTNGMSMRSRDGVNSNAAIAVSVLPEDFGSTPTGAIEFQRELERKAFVAGNCDYSAPCQTLGSFYNRTSTNECAEITPTYMNGKVKMCDMHNVLPYFITDMLKVGISDFGRKIKGFDKNTVPITGVETRTSAPVRIMRNDKYCAVGHDRIYPCGEGAGYAGGIMSAAIDGLRIAKAIMEEYRPFEE